MTAWLYSSITVAQILNGKHHNRAVIAHQITLQVLFDLWIDTFFEYKPVLRQNMKTAIEQVSETCGNGLDVAQAHSELLRLLEDLKLKKHLAEFDRNNEKYPMNTWARMYMKQVANLLDFIRGTRNRHWVLHLASLDVYLLRCLQQA